METMIRTLLAFLVLWLPLAAEEIVVSLATESQAKPIYLAPWTQVKGELGVDYLQELGNILCFDLNTAGQLVCAEATQERKELAQREGINAYDAQRWRGLGVLYVLRGLIEGKRLHVRVDGPKSASFVAQLSGNLSTDRQQIHRLCDALHQDLFSKTGIADTCILFTIRHQTPDGWRSELWVADYDGANARPVTNEGSYCVTPNFAPDGSFAYVSYRTGQPKVYLGSFIEGGSHRLTELRGNQLMPVTSPKGDQIAFISDAGGNPDLFIQSPGDKPRQIFTARGAAQASPTFSPDGKQLAFVSNKDGTPRIYIIDVPLDDESPRSKKTRLITRACRESTCPAWSPDGRYIAYSAKTDGTRQIWLYDTTTQTERPLTHSPGHKENPSWAADSQHLVFNSETRSGCELFIVSLTNPQPIQITTGPGEKRFPSWSTSR